MTSASLWPVGGGEMGERIRSRDWAATSLGHPGSWPQSLRTSIDVVLGTHQAMCLVWGADLVLFYNDAYAPLLGLRHPGAIGRPIAEVWSDIWGEIEPLVQRALSGESVRFEDMHLSMLRNGYPEDTWWTFTYSPLRNETGAVAGMLNVTTETTGKVVALRDAADERGRLRESEARFRQMADAVPQIVWITDPDGRVEFFNKQWSDYTGRAYEPTTASQVAAEHVHPEDGPATMAAFGEARRTGTTFLAEHRIRSRSGTYRWFLVRGEPQRHPATGEILRWFGASVDIHDRRLAEAALRLSEANLREFNDTLESQVAERTGERDRMWNTSPDLMLVIDFEGIFRRVNPAWTSVLGYAPEELVGRHVNAFVLPDDHARTTGAYEMAAEGGQPTLGNRYRHKDGSVRWIAWVAAPYGDLTYATGRDITRERQAREELERAQEALRQSQKMEAVGQLTGGLAHDFNNLLAGISGSLDMIDARVRQGRVGDVGRYVAGAQGAAKRAAALTHRLLAFSRRQTLDPKATDVVRLIEGLRELVQRTVGPQIAVETRAETGIWPTLVDPNQLENALLNLCINARDAMPEGGRITIRTANLAFDARSARKHDLTPGDYVSLCVADTGTGMTADVIEKAFDPFFTTKPIGVGTGLGLSMIYGFVRQSGGHAEIRSEIGQGTTVCLYLPRHDREAVAEDPAGPPRLQARSRGRSVLVVDDEPLVRMLVVDAVEDLGHATFEAGDGPQAMTILRSDAPIDLLITDVGLPNGMNGRQIAEAAREIRPGLKVMFVTGYAENAVLGQEPLALGMQVVTKPFDIALLSNRIDAMLDG